LEATSAQVAPVSPEPNRLPSDVPNPTNGLIRAGKVRGSRTSAG
jgi:hypothetical protein